MKKPRKPRKRKWVAVACVLAVAYVGSFYCWKWVALKQAAPYGLIGYYFFWPPDEDDWLPEAVVRIFYLPLIFVDWKLFGGEPLGSPPLEHLSRFEREGDSRWVALASPVSVAFCSTPAFECR